MTLVQMLADLELETLYRLKCFLEKQEDKVYKITDELQNDHGAYMFKVGIVEDRIVFFSGSGIQVNIRTIDLKDLTKFVDKITDGKCDE